MRLVLRDGENEVAVRVEERQGGAIVHVGDSMLEVGAWSVRDGRVWFVVDGATHEASVARDGERRWVHVDGRADREVLAGAAQKRASRRGGKQAPDQLTAAMHSQVVSVAVKVGDAVGRGDALIVLEAMKMETRIASPHAGKVVAVHCAVGDVVERGRVLIEVQPTE